MDCEYIDIVANSNTEIVRKLFQLQIHAMKSGICLTYIFIKEQITSQIAVEQTFDKIICKQVGTYDCWIKDIFFFPGVGLVM